MKKAQRAENSNKQASKEGNSLFEVFVATSDSIPGRLISDKSSFFQRLNFVHDQMKYTAGYHLGPMAPSLDDGALLLCKYKTWMRTCSQGDFAISRYSNFYLMNHLSHGCGVTSGLRHRPKSTKMVLSDAAETQL